MNTEKRYWYNYYKNFYLPVLRSIHMKDDEILDDLRGSLKEHIDSKRLWQGMSEYTEQKDLMIEALEEVIRELEDKDGDKNN